MTALDPLFPARPGAVLFSTQQAAQLIAVPASTVAECSRRIRTWAQERFIHVRDKRGEGPTSWNLFALADVVAAGVLAAVTDAGIGNRDALAALSLAFYAEQYRVPSLESEFAHPIEEAIHACARGHYRGVQLFGLRDLETGRPFFVGQIHAPDLPSFQASAREIERATLTVSLLPIVTCALSRAKGMHQ